MPVPSEDSLFHIVMNQSATDSAGRVKTHLSSFKSYKGPTEQRYKIVNEGEDLKTKTLVDMIFDDSNQQIVEKRKAILGDVTREGFDEQFNNGRKRNKEKFGDLAPLFALKSFPETFFYPEIAQHLVATRHLTNVETAKLRIAETGEVVANALGKHNGLAIMLALGKSHEHRPPHLYTADTVEFTLLTFSYFGAKASGVKETDWFYYWRVFGSMMGLPKDRLHSNYSEAQGRMKKLHQQCPEKPTADSIQLLDTFIKGFLSEEEDVRNASQVNFISKRMRAYLKSVDKWPKGLPDKPSVD